MDEKPKQERELLAEPIHIRADCRLIQRFGIRDEARQAIMDELSLIALGTKKNPSGGDRLPCRPREQAAAAGTIIKADKLNMDQERRHAEVGEDRQEAIEEAQTVAEQARAMTETILPPGQEQ